MVSMPNATRQRMSATFLPTMGLEFLVSAATVPTDPTRGYELGTACKLCRCPGAPLHR